MGDLTPAISGRVLICQWSWPAFVDGWFS